ncbi:MAG: rRNA ((1402)-2-O)-methyltransferase [Pseudomonadota bacterium]
MSSTRLPTLFIVATPIGTLSDMSPRARAVLSEVAFVACEDTRRTKELFQALALPSVPLVSLHEHNETEKSSSLVERLLASEGRCAALVSDAGTPAISDPGAIFVDACHSAGIRIESVPGPSSLVSAIAAAGFLQPRILFSGFLQRSQNEQRDEFKRWQAVAPCVAVCFESPHRILSTLKTAADFFSPETRVCLSREISKKFEEHLRMPLAELVQKIEDGHLVKGECILTFELTPQHFAGAAVQEKTFDDVVTETLAFLDSHPEARLKDVVRDSAEQHRLNAKELYNTVLARRRT